MINSRIKDRRKSGRVFFKPLNPLSCIINRCIHLSSEQKRFPLFELVFALKFKPQNLILEPRYLQI